MQGQPASVHGSLGTWLIPGLGDTGLNQYSQPNQYSCQVLRGWPSLEGVGGLWDLPRADTVSGVATIKVKAIQGQYLVASPAIRSTKTPTCTGSGGTGSITHTSLPLFYQISLGLVRSMISHYTLPRELDNVATGVSGEQWESGHTSAPGPCREKSGAPPQWQQTHGLWSPPLWWY